MGKRRTTYAGRRNGMFTVLTEPNELGYCKCKCDCGVEKMTLAKNLCHMPSSCGCQKQALAKKYNTNINMIRSKMQMNRIDPRNKTGVTGVYYDGRTHKYLAYIGFNNKLIRIGTFKTVEEAAAARREAEQQYFMPILELVNGGDVVC